MCERRKIVLQGRRHKSYPLSRDLFRGPGRPWADILDDCQAVTDSPFLQVHTGAQADAAAGGPRSCVAEPGRSWSRQTDRSSRPRFTGKRSHNPWVGRGSPRARHRTVVEKPPRRETRLMMPASVGVFGIAGTISS